MDNFIFGALSSEEARINRLRSRYRGVRHDYHIDPIAPVQGESPTIKVTTSLETAVDKVVCRILEPEVTELPLVYERTKWDDFNWFYYREWQVDLPPQPEGTLVRYVIHAHPGDGRGPVPADDGEIFSYLVGDPRPPQWTKEAIIYQVFPDRFHPGSGRPWPVGKRIDEIHGGTLAGIIEHLDYIADLGFNCIWLNPFFPDELTHHGYHATDYFNVNPRLGTLEELRELVDQAHSQGIRLLLDFVANHWGRSHPTFQQASQDRNSPYHHWYRWIRWPDEYETFFKVKELPQINLDHRPARQHLLDAATFWLEEYDFDGFRLDYALGPTLDFWAEFRAAVAKVKPELWLFGEVTDTPPRLLKYWGRLHGCLDFLLQNALGQTFAVGSMTVAAFDAFLKKHENYFPAEYSRPSFLDNHDVNRFLWITDGDRRRLKLAALCQFTLSGPPIVYYGTEVGLSQERDVVGHDGRHTLAESRLPMLWGDEQDQDLLAYYRQLISFRKNHPVLWRGRRETVHLDERAGTYIYSRTDERETVYVAINASDQERQLEVADHTFLLPAWSGDVLVPDRA